jgi:hypothetical protein
MFSAPSFFNIAFRISGQGTNSEQNCGLVSSFKRPGSLYSRLAELWIDGPEVWIKEPQAVRLSLPISGTLTSADGRTITLATLE